MGLTSIIALLKQIITMVMTIVMVFSTGVAGTAKTEVPEGGFDNVKNVIYLIGDGMGPLHLEKTKQEKGISLIMDTMPLQGRSRTSSQSSKVTDSAAGGTALATGHRTYNGALGVFMEDPLKLESYPVNLTEVCMANGMKTGVVTTDKTSGATPSAFSAHTYSRGNTRDISLQQQESGIDLIWGNETEFVTQSRCEKGGYTLITTYDEMMALEEGTKSFAQFTGDTWKTEQSGQTPTLSQMTMKAIDLLDDTDEGFFLMVEGAHIDKHSHSNNSEAMTEALTEFDKTIEAVLEYAAADGETLVVVTADHETGGIVLKDDGTYSYTQTSHSAADVPVLVFGSDNFITNGATINNYEIPIRIAYSLGLDEDTFPAAFKTFQ